MSRKLTKRELLELDEFMENPFYREIVENAPGEQCREYIIRGLVRGFYAGFDPEICRKEGEDGLTAEDWQYVMKHLAGHTPFLKKCTVRIQEQSGTTGPGLFVPLSGVGSEETCEGRMEK